MAEAPHDEPVSTVDGFKPVHRRLWFLVAFAICALIVFELKDWPGLLLSLQPGTDMHAFSTNADGFLRGNWPGSAPIYRAPLFTVVLAALKLCTSDVLIGKLFGQCLMMALAVALTADATSRLINKLAGHLAGALFLGYGGTVFWCAVLHSTTTEILCVAIAIWTLERLRRRPSPWAAAAWGLAGACLCLVRPNFLLVAPMLVLGIGLEFWRAKERQRNIRLLAIAIVVFSIPIGALSIRNSLLLGKLSSFSTNGKSTYVIANSTDSKIYNFAQPKGPLLRPTQMAFWQRQGERALAYWRSWEYPQNANFYLFRENSAVLKTLRVNHALIGALAIIGSLMILRERRDLWPYLALFWGYYLTVVAFFIIGRFRVTVIPAAAIPAAYALSAMIERILRRHWRQALVIALPAAILMIAMRPWETAIRQIDRQFVFRLALESRKLDVADREIQRWRDGSLSQDSAEDQARMAPALAALQACVAVLDVSQRAQEGLASLDSLRREHPDSLSLAVTYLSASRYLGHGDQVDLVTIPPNGERNERVVNYFEEVLRAYNRPPPSR